MRAAAWGAGIATAGAAVVAVSRTAEALAELANGAGTIQPGIADAGDATVAVSHGRAAWLVVPVLVWFVVRPLFWRGFGWRAFGWRTNSRRCWPYGPSV